MEHLDTVREQLVSEVALLRERIDTGITVQQVPLFTKRLADVDNKLIANEQEIQRSCSETAASEYFTQYNSLRSNILDLEMAIAQVTPVPSSPAVSTASDRDKAVPLPELKNPPFTGDPVEWPMFSRNFEELIRQHPEITPHHKFKLLNSMLEGEPRTFLINLPPNEAGFESAWELLRQRYDNTKRTAWQMVLQILKFPNARSPAEILNLVDKIRVYLRTLEAVGFKLEGDAIHLFLQVSILEKLNEKTKEKWGSKLSKLGAQVPKVDELLKFLQDKVERSTPYTAEPEPSFISSSAPKPSNNTRASTSAFQYPPRAQNPPRPANTGQQSSSQPNSQFKCFECSLPHHISRCPVLTQATAQERKKLVDRRKLCVNCLFPGHKADVCRSTYRCRTCQGKHHTLMHVDTPAAPVAGPSVSTVACAVDNSTILLATALVRVTGADGKIHNLRAMIDGGSQVNLISQHAAQVLGLKEQPCRTTVVSAFSTTHDGSKSARLTIQSLTENHSHPIEAMITPEVVTELPTIPIKLSAFSHLLMDKPLADPEFHIPAKIDLLLNAQVQGNIFKPRAESHENLVIQETKLGWVLYGGIPQLTNNNRVVASVINFHKFWEIEDVPSPFSREFTLEETEVENLTNETMRQVGDGKYQVRMPFRNEPPTLGLSRYLAFQRYLSLEDRFRREPAHEAAYRAVIEDYFEQDHIEPASDYPDDPSRVYYMPHHAVMKETSTSTKCRVVFDCSMTTLNGPSLNAQQANGPKLQRDIFELLVRFRKHPIALTADVRQMYRQVWIRPEDRDFQRILWRRNPGEPIKDYRLKTVTFGQKIAPYLAVKALQACAEKTSYPPAARAIVEDFYVDDLISGAATVDDAAHLQTSVANALAAACFPTHKWASNSPAALAAVPLEYRAADTTVVGQDDEQKALGIGWNCTSDEFQILTPDPERPEWTRRAVLSLSNSVYDPVGWVSPFTVIAKQIVQHVFKETRTWDTLIPENLAIRWDAWVAQLPSLKHISLPRCIQPVGSTVELVGFSDASLRAFAAVIYARITDAQGQVSIRLVAAKTKVAPLKGMTIPRLELQGAVLLAHLAQAVTIALGLPLVAAYTDSTITLGWLRGEPSRWKTFVANRVIETTQIIPAKLWQHTKGEDNPADLGSRGIPASQLANKKCLWWTGPAWLKSTIISGSTFDAVVLPEEETRPIKVIAAVVSPPPFAHELLRRFEKFDKLVRVVAWLHRAFFTTREFNLSLLQKAKLTVCRWVQEEEFPDEMASLRQGKAIKLSSSLAPLNPVLGEDGVIRVGGRLRHAKMENRSPIILPSRHPVTRMIVLKTHGDLLHAGPTATDHALRREFWVVHPISTIKFALKRCVKCTKARAQLAHQQMADLPKFRSNPSIKAFDNCGVDYAGPITLRTHLSRGTRHYKGYIALFICLATRAVHLELVSDLTTDAFLAALQRFCCRRGVPNSIYSDNGTNFIGAANQIAGLTQDPIIQQYLMGRNIHWFFNPPSAPHFGGGWEAGIKSVKTHLAKVVGKTPLTYEEYQTLLCRIEAVLNSRPLLPMSADPEDLDALTPGHFLIGGPLMGLPEAHLPANLSALRRWDLVNKLSQSLWSRWSAEYVTRLQHRPKWWRQAPNIEPGTLVIIQDPNRPPMCWRLGRVTATHPGADGLVRVVSLHTAYGPTQRPIHKLCVLPLDGVAAEDMSAPAEEEDRSPIDNEHEEVPTRVAAFPGDFVQALSAALPCVQSDSVVQTPLVQMLMLPSAEEEVRSLTNNEREEVPTRVAAVPGDFVQALSAALPCVQSDSVVRTPLVQMSMLPMISESSNPVPVAAPDVAAVTNDVTNDVTNAVTHDVIFAVDALPRRSRRLQGLEPEVD